MAQAYRKNLPFQNVLSNSGTSGLITFGPPGSWWTATLATISFVFLCRLRPGGTLSGGGRLLSLETGTNDATNICTDATVANSVRCVVNRATTDTQYKANTTVFVPGQWVWLVVAVNTGGGTGAKVAFYKRGVGPNGGSVVSLGVNGTPIEGTGTVAHGVANNLTILNNSGGVSGSDIQIAFAGIIPSITLTAAQVQTLTTQLEQGGLEEIATGSGKGSTGLAAQFRFATFPGYLWAGAKVYDPLGGLKGTISGSVRYYPGPIISASPYTALRSGSGLPVTTSTKSVTINAVLQKTLTKSVTINAVLQKTLTKTVTINALLVKTFTKSVTINAVLQKTLTKSVTIDAVLQKTLTKTVTVNAVLQKTLTKSVTINAVLQKTLTKTVTIDAVLQKTLSKTVTINAVLQKTLTKTVTINAVLQKTLTKAVTINAVLQKTLSKTVTIDAVLSAGTTTITKTVTINAVLQKTLTKTVTINAVLQKTLTKTVTVNAVLQKTLTKTVTIDAFLGKQFTKTVTINALLAKFGVTKTVVIDAVLVGGSVGLQITLQQLYGPSAVQSMYSAAGTTMELYMASDTAGLYGPQESQELYGPVITPQLD